MRARHRGASGRRVAKRRTLAQHRVDHVVERVVGRSPRAPAGDTGRAARSTAAGAKPRPASRSTARPTASRRDRTPRRCDRCRERVAATRRSTSAVIRRGRGRDGPQPSGGGEVLGDVAVGDARGIAIVAWRIGTKLRERERAPSGAHAGAAWRALTRFDVAAVRRRDEDPGTCTARREREPIAVRRPRRTLGVAVADDDAVAARARMCRRARARAGGVRFRWRRRTPRAHRRARPPATARPPGRALGAARLPSRRADPQTRHASPRPRTKMMRPSRRHGRLARPARATS